jgi:hypothetical protein
MEYRRMLCWTVVPFHQAVDHLFHLVKSQLSSSEPADPAMIIIPPVEQYAADYTFTTPKYSQGSYANFFLFSCSCWCWNCYKFLPPCINRHHLLNQVILTSSSASFGLFISLSSCSTCGSVTYGGKTYSKGKTLTVTLNRFDAIQLQSKGDLTGENSLRLLNRAF